MTARIIFGLASLMAFGALMEGLPLRGYAHSVAAFLIISALIPVAIAVHELGHAWAVRRLGGKVVSFTILGVELIKSAPPPDPRFSGREIGGHVGYVFEGGETRHEAARIAAAGPGANLVLALLAGLLAILIASSPPGQKAAPISTTTIVAGEPAQRPAAIDGPRLRSDEEVRQRLKENPLPGSRWGRNMLAMILAALGILSLGMGLANLIPFRGSDGAALLHALRSPGVATLP